HGPGGQGQPREPAELGRQGVACATQGGSTDRAHGRRRPRGRDGAQAVNRVERGKAAKRLATDEHAAVHRVAALLLDYPDEARVAQLPAIHEVVNGMSARFREPLTRLVSHLARVDVREAAAHYVATFDHRKRCCLFLTYYAHGDTRNR